MYPIGTHGARRCRSPACSDRLNRCGRLIEAATGGHLWAERYDGTLEDVFALQDKVTGEIVRALAITLKQGEEVAFGQHETENVKAYDEFLAGWAYFNRNRPISTAFQDRFGYVSLRQ